ncbi:hypothetical protein RJ640_010674 [Escallonia rubra]|uniref:B box-type domain-containing protein n=1 Tax=Escallonia rubra TaxID=112253 RepID=A0AA88U9B1_9ASTE|nr:hypothetical protein RJ640_010674 [Escallonia rubra]
MEHFSHEHPLILREVLKEDGEDRVCYACLEPITGHAYSCTECDFFLHKTCGDQPRTIELGFHPQHPLTLFQRPHYDSTRKCWCDVCYRKLERFTYSCKPCGFDACISCGSGKIRHFSHDHPLISTDALKLDGLEVICHACQKQVKDHAFSCSEHCDFLLHQECLGLLKRYIQHFSHPRHRLVFHKRPPFNSSRSPCDYCGNSWEHFSYYCESCRFKLCVPCASLSAAHVPPEIEHVLHPEHRLSLFVRERYSCSTEPCKCCGQFLALLAYGCDLCKFNICVSCASCALSPQLTKPSFHEHPLIIMREALFKCDACGADDKDMSYLCTTCKFWIHKSCALLESRIQCGSHRHPLTLSYSLPEEYVKFKQSCGICGQRLKPVYWVYACSPCRYFAHVKCATRGETENFRNGESQIREDQEDLDSNLISLPIMSYDSRNLMISFLWDVSLKEIQSGTELHHISHGHPLILCDVSDNIGSMETDVLVCHACTQAITGSFYACSSQCSFLLHRICAELPHEVQCAIHPEHPLVLHPKAPNSFTFFRCQACRTISNGFSYRCDPCDFQVDLMCAYLPHTVSHEAHNHPLQIRGPDPLPCNGCSLNKSPEIRKPPQRNKNLEWNDNQKGLILVCIKKAMSCKDDVDEYCKP